ncbi:MAG: hypothetical protein ABIT70_05150 [Sulfuriferula sp.]
MTILFRNIILIACLAHSTLLMAAERSCPKPDTFLSQSVGNAKATLNSLFPNNWSLNGPLCSTGYSNLMTNQLSDLCDRPIDIDRIFVYGFGDSSQIIGVSYILRGNISQIQPSLLIPTIRKEQVIKTDQIPASLAPLFRNERGESLNLRSSTGRFFVHASSSHDPDQTSINIYDLRAIANQQKEFDTCLKDFGFQK